MPLDKNESYWMLTDELAGLVRAPGARTLSTYPDYDELKKALALYAGVAPENIVVTPGSVTAIEYIVRAYAEREGKVLLPAPTFYCYESILESAKEKIVPIIYEEQNGRFIFPRQETLAALARGTTKALFLCHPNNPLGCPLSREDVSVLIEAVRGTNTLLVSDEAYFEFSSGLSFLPYLKEFPNLIIIRTLSKALALSGARIGYIIASPKVVKEVEKVILPWPVAHESVTAALAFLAHIKEILPRRALVIDARGTFIRRLSAIPHITVYPSETNFVLIRVPDAAHTHAMLLKRDIRTALGEPMSHFPQAKELLKNTLRIAIPAPESEVSFIKALKQTLS